MSPEASAADRQQRVTEFLRLLPLTLEIAGLPRSDLGRYFNEGQLELRVNVIRLAYKLARGLVVDVSTPSQGREG